MKIAIDAMGGDFAPLEPVLGSIEAVRANDHIEVVLVGDKQQIFDILEANNEAKNPRISVHHASEVIGMDEHPGQALRKKKDASIVVATALVRDNHCDAVIAPGIRKTPSYHRMARRSCLSYCSLPKGKHSPGFRWY